MTQVEIIKAALYEQINLLIPKENSISVSHAKQRLEAVAENAPLFLTWLAEPWLDSQDSQISTTLIHCAKIHLYARILDDALDENLPIHRLIVLRAQPFFWFSVGELAKSYPHCWNEATELIKQTIQAVECDDENSNPELWGLKNHHLLIIPLFLSGDTSKWQQVKNALSDFIWINQVSDEYRQGQLKNRNLKRMVIKKVEEILMHQTPQTLFQKGWTSAAQRTLWECEQLLKVID